MSSRSRGVFRAWVFPLHLMHIQMRGQVQPELLEQDRLMCCRLGHAASPDGDAVSGGQHHVHHLYLRDLIEDFARLSSQPRSLAELPQGFPDHIGQKTDQNVRLHTLFPLVPYWADR